MRPVRLTMAAFGPFAGVEEIRFEALGKNPLFLINGPTGSGKTTVLDAICYALYGKTTGDEREAAQMRCDIASSDQLTYVELVFSLRGQAWRVRREPDQWRPSGRGEGQTRHKPHAELLRLAEDGSTSVEAVKLTEVKACIETMLGLNVEQFRQVMVLPQGEFRKLLVAKSAEREKVFSHLFQTQVYDRIESALKEQAAGVRKQLEASRNQQLGVLEAVDYPRESELVQALAVQQQRHRALRKRRDQAERSWQSAEQACLLAEKELAEFERLETERVALTNIRAGKPEIERLRVKLLNGQRALRLQPAHERDELARQALTQAGERLTQARQALRQAQQQHQQRQERLDVLAADTEAMSALEEQLRQLNGYRERLGQLLSAGELKRGCAQKLAQQEQLLENTRSSLALTQQKLEKQQRALKQAEAQFARLGQLQLEVKQGEAELMAARDLAQLQSEIQQLQLEWQQKTTALTQATTRLEQAQAEADQLDYAWHRGQAAVLAKKLEDGVPCPVCGSEQHPMPAQSEIELPDQAQREAARNVLEQARSHQASVDSEVVRLQTALKHQQAQASRHRQQLGVLADRAMSGLEAELDALRGQLRESERQSERIEVLSGQLVSLSEQIDEAQQQLARLEQGCGLVRAELEQARGEYRQLAREVPEPWQDQDRLEREIETGQQRLLRWQNHREDARQALGQAELKIERAQSDLGNAQEAERSRAAEAEVAHHDWLGQLQESPFQDVSEFERSQVAARQLELMQAQIERFSRQLEQAQGAVASLEKALENRHPPELDRLKQKAGHAEEAWRARQHDYEQLDRQLNGLLNAQEKLASLRERHVELEAQYALVGTLADTATGKTGPRISLQRFVLSVMLDDVLLVASERLKRMSRGRYTLHRQLEKGRGASAGGLDLVVEDAYYGSRRPVVTLSGGESFMAALSLALALSEVVQSRAGGVRLDTLFIDEGFGSLDSEALEMAVRTLVELQSSGRMVGVISHVPELKEWIGVRLDVIPGRAGSTTRTVVA